MCIRDRFIHAWTYKGFSSNGNTFVSEDCTYSSVYAEYLRSLYAILTPTQNTPDQWPPTTAKKVFRLTMIVGEDEKTHNDNIIRMVVKGELNNASLKCTPIELKDILQPIHEDKRRVVLIEGAPGSGKTTLSVYICQQWGVGKLFQEYKIVILVQLRDPEIIFAKGIKDLLPHRNNVMAEKVYDEITSTDGQGVLWVFDGWDEVSSSLPTYHIIRKLIETKLTWKTPLHKSDVIVTSRPISSLALSLIHI